MGHAAAAAATTTTAQRQLGDGLHASNQFPADSDGGRNGCVRLSTAYTDVGHLRRADARILLSAIGTTGGAVARLDHVFGLAATATRQSAAGGATVATAGVDGTQSQAGGYGRAVGECGSANGGDTAAGGQPGGIVGSDRGRPATAARPNRHRGATCPRRPHVVRGHEADAAANARHRGGWWRVDIAYHLATAASPTTTTTTTTTREMGRPAGDAWQRIVSAPGVPVRLSATMGGLTRAGTVQVRGQAGAGGAGTGLSERPSAQRKCSAR
eukprot:ctg_1031.g340